jgi:hypothetical protein
MGFWACGLPQCSQNWACAFTGEPQFTQRVLVEFTNSVPPPQPRNKVAIDWTRATYHIFCKEDGGSCELVPPGYVRPSGIPVMLYRADGI